MVVATRDGGHGGGRSTFDSARDVADAAGCSGYEMTEPDFGTTDTARCRLGGRDVEIYIFEDQDRFLSYAEAGCGLGSGEFTVGHNWALSVADEQLADRLGGGTDDVCS